MAENGFDLADVIVDLRRTLKRAQEKGAAEDLRFLIEDIEIEVNAMVKEEGGGKLGVKFWVLNAEAAGKMAGEATQKIRLTIKPNVEGKPLDITGHTTMPKMPGSGS